MNFQVRLSRWWRRSCGCCSTWWRTCTTATSRRSCCWSCTRSSTASSPKSSCSTRSTTWSRTRRPRSCRTWRRRCACTRSCPSWPRHRPGRPPPPPPQPKTTTTAWTVSRAAETLVAPPRTPTTTATSRRAGRPRPAAHRPSRPVASALRVPCSSSSFSYFCCLSLSRFISSFDRSDGRTVDWSVDRSLGSFQRAFPFLFVAPCPLPSTHPLNWRAPPQLFLRWTVLLLY